MNIYKYLPFIITCIVAFIVFFFLVTENQRLMAENVMLETTINKQNKEIEAQKLELKNYVCDLETMKDFALREYERAFSKTKNDKTCEGRLRHLEAILQSYEN